MQKPSTKYQQTKFNNILKRSYTMIVWDLFQACKDGSTFTNQSMYYNILKIEYKSYDHLNRHRKNI